MLIVRISSGNTKDLLMGPRPLWGGSISFKFFAVALLWSWAVEDFEDLRTPVLDKSYHHFITLTYKAEQTLTPPEPQGQKLLVVYGMVVGPFRGEEDGICGIASDVKVKNANPATPGSVRVKRARKYQRAKVGRDPSLDSRQKRGRHRNCRARSLSACNARPL